MKQLIILLFYLLSGYAYGAQQATPEPSTAPSKQTQNQKKAKTATSPPSPQGIKGDWPKPFVPSERIGADSVVSFPVDI
ncbi:MAG: hypothetical protein OEM02_12395 [Desulfobulbaceae bacterium]|nr:hypothetical protein [Desulfobulbaceae bacterium]